MSLLSSMHIQLHTEEAGIFVGKDHVQARQGVRTHLHSFSIIINTLSSQTVLHKQTVTSSRDSITHTGTS